MRCYQVYTESEHIPIHTDDDCGKILLRGNNPPNDMLKRLAYGGKFSGGLVAIGVANWGNEKELF